MSLQTWEEEFYPESAEEAAERGEAAAVEHSLRKWEGLRYENLNRHQMWASSALAREFNTGRGLELSGETCALCELCLRAGAGESCRICPLFKARGGSACDRRKFDETESPWNSWTDDRDPEPMIFWLKKAKEHCNG